MELRKFRARGWHWNPGGWLEWDDGIPFEDFLLQLLLLRIAGVA